MTTILENEPRPVRMGRRTGVPFKSRRWYVRMMPKLLTIKDRVSGRPVQFVPNPAQRHIIRRLGERNIILKVRQELGFSSGLCGYMFEKTILNRGFDSLLVVHKKTEDVMRKFTQMRNMFYWGIPDVWRPRCDKDSTAIMQFEQLQSSYSIIPATEDAGVSGSYSMIICTEMAHWRDPAGTMTSLLPTLRPGGMLIIESTAHGYNQFKDYWDDATQGRRKDLIPHFYGRDWIYDPDGTWERGARSLYDIDGWLENYPATPEEAFRMGTDTFYAVFVPEDRPVGNLAPGYRYNANLPVDAYIDFGYRHPRIQFVQEVRPDEELIEFDEWVGHDKLIDDLRDALKRYPIRVVYCDPAGDQANTKSHLTDIQVLKRAGFRVKYTFAGRFRDIPTGASIVRRYFCDANGTRRYFIVPEKCPGAIDDLKYLQTDPNNPEKPLKDGIHDHSNDARRYGLVNYHIRNRAWVGSRA